MATDTKSKEHEDHPHRIQKALDAIVEQSGPKLEEASRTMNQFGIRGSVPESVFLKAIDEKWWEGVHRLAESIGYRHTVEPFVESLLTKRPGQLKQYIEHCPELLLAQKTGPRSYNAPRHTLKVLREECPERLPTLLDFLADQAYFDVIEKGPWNYSRADDDNEKLSASVRSYLVDFLKKHGDSLSYDGPYKGVRGILQCLTPDDWRGHMDELKDITDPKKPLVNFLKTHEDFDPESNTYTVKQDYHEIEARFAFDLYQARDEVPNLNKIGKTDRKTASSFLTMLADEFSEEKWPKDPERFGVLAYDQLTPDGHSRFSLSDYIYENKLDVNYLKKVVQNINTTDTTPKRDYLPHNSRFDIADQLPYYKAALELNKTGPVNLQKDLPQSYHSKKRALESLHHALNNLPDSKRTKLLERGFKINDFDTESYTMLAQSSYASFRKCLARRLEQGRRNLMTYAVRMGDIETIKVGFENADFEDRYMILKKAVEGHNAQVAETLIDEVDDVFAYVEKALTDKFNNNGNGLGVLKQILKQADITLKQNYEAIQEKLSPESSQTRNKATFRIQQLRVLDEHSDLELTTLVNPIYDELPELVQIWLQNELPDNQAASLML